MYNEVQRREGIWDTVQCTPSVTPAEASRPKLFYSLLNSAYNLHGSAIADMRRINQATLRRPQ